MNQIYKSLNLRIQSFCVTTIISNKEVCQLESFIQLLAILLRLFTVPFN